MNRFKEMTPYSVTSRVSDRDSAAIESKARRVPIGDSACYGNQPLGKFSRIAYDNFWVDFFGEKVQIFETRKTIEKEVI